MRVSPGQRKDPETIQPAKRRFNFGRQVTDSPDRVFVGLVGGCDPASIAVRGAGSYLGCGFVVGE